MKSQSIQLCSWLLLEIWYSADSRQRLNKSEQKMPENKSNLIWSQLRMNWLNKPYAPSNDWRTHNFIVRLLESQEDIKTSLITNLILAKLQLNMISSELDCHDVTGQTPPPCRRDWDCTVMLIMWTIWTECNQQVIDICAVNCRISSTKFVTSNSYALISNSTTHQSIWLPCFIHHLYITPLNWLTSGKISVTVFW